MCVILAHIRSLSTFEDIVFFFFHVGRRAMRMFLIDRKDNVFNRSLSTFGDKFSSILGNITNWVVVRKEGNKLSIDNILYN